MKNILVTVVLVLAVLGVVFLSLHNRSSLASKLPPKHVYAAQVEASFAAGVGSFAILGTGSMAPYIAPSTPGLDPLHTIVAYAKAGGRYEDIKVGDLCIYWYVMNGVKISVIHQAVEKDGSGWIMSGFNNARSESWARVTKDNFTAIVESVHTW